MQSYTAALMAGVAIVAIPVFAPVSALAQTRPAVSDPVTGLEEVVVTAQKRQENRTCRSR
jgi:hypothetical protein